MLMLENIEIAEQVRVEGKTEDIEIKLSNGKCLYSQAKSVVNSWDFANVKRNLEKSLTTLSNASAKSDCDRLIYVTNSPNPLGNKSSMSIFYGRSRRKYNDMPPKYQKVIDDLLQKLSIQDFNKENFSVQVIPFETDDLTERYKVVKNTVDQFIMSIRRPNLAGISQEVLDVWQKEFFENATMTNTEKVINKKDLVWPLIALMTDIRRCDDPISELMDECDYEDLTTRYKTLINNRCEQFDFATKVLSDYQGFQCSNGNKTEEFINLSWIDYKDEFAVSSITDEALEKLVKVILYHIIRQKNLVNDVKKRVRI